MPQRLILFSTVFLLILSHTILAIESSNEGDREKRNLGCSVARKLSQGFLNAGQLTTEQSLSLNYFKTNYPEEYRQCAGETSFQANAAKSAPPAAFPYEGSVSFIVDSQTVALTSGQKVRLLGIKVHEDKRKETAEYLKKTLQGHKVRIHYDQERSDRFGKLQGYIFLGDVFINRSLIDEGFAAADIVPPNTLYQYQLTLDKNAPAAVYEDNYEDPLIEIQKNQRRMIYMLWGSMILAVIFGVFLRRFFKR